MSDSIEGPADIAKEMLREAAVEGFPKLFEASGHAHYNVGVPYQQIRARALAWALIRQRQVKHGSVIAIAGGGFSGMMLAVSLALQRRCIVHLFEKEDMLLKLFRESHHRYLHPNLNSRDLPVRYDPRWSAPLDRPLIFDWEEGTASEVAHFWLREFQRYADELPIFVHVDSEVREFRNVPGDASIELEIGHPNGVKISRRFDLAIAAMGFGAENNKLAIRDYSYWRSGVPEFYRAFRAAPKKKVLISGCGDSGVIEALHHAFEEFDQGSLPALYPVGARYESYVQPRLEQSTFWQILYSREADRFDGKVVSELCWFASQKWREDMAPHGGPPVADYPGAYSRELAALYTEIHDGLKQLGVDVATPIDGMEAQEALEEQLVRLRPSDQLALKRQVARRIENIASLELKEIMEAISPTEHYNVDRLRAMTADAPLIILNDRTPTAYTAALSPINLIYLRLLSELGLCSYRQGEISEARPEAGKMIAHYADGSEETYDHIATRYGLSKASGVAEMLQPKHKRLNYGDWLLEAAYELRDDTAGGAIIRRHADLSKEALKIARDRFLQSGRPSCERSLTIMKRQYIFEFEVDEEPIKRQVGFAKKQAALSDALKKNRAVRFDNRKSWLSGD